MSEKKCFSCRYYHVYYIKRVCQFERLEYGVCDRSREALQDKYGTCEKWRSNRLNRDRQLAVASAVLENAASSINELRQIVYEAKEENETE